MKARGGLGQKYDNNNDPCNVGDDVPKKRPWVNHIPNKKSKQLQAFGFWICVYVGCIEVRW